MVPGLPPEQSPSSGGEWRPQNKRLTGSRGAQDEGGEAGGSGRDAPRTAPAGGGGGSGTDGAGRTVKLRKGGDGGDGDAIKDDQ